MEIGDRRAVWVTHTGEKNYGGRINFTWTYVTDQDIEGDDSGLIRLEGHHTIFDSLLVIRYKSDIGPNYIGGLWEVVDE